MTFEEFKNVIGECVQNGDKLVENADNIIEAYKTMTDTAEAFKNEVDALKVKNDDLRDTNTKLLLRQSFDVKEEEQPVTETPEEIVNKFFEKMKGN